MVCKMGRKEPVSKIFDYCFPHREQTDKTLKQIELRTVYPIVKFRCGDARTLEEVGLLGERGKGVNLAMHVREETAVNSQ